MKINFWIPHTRVSGGIIVILQYAKELSSLGHDVQLIVESPYFVRRWLANAIRFVPNWMRSFGEFNLKRVKSFKDPSAYEGAEVVVADSWRVASHLVYVPDVIKKIHFVQHDERLYHGNKDEVDAVYKMPIEKVVVSNWIKEVFEKDYQYTPSVILNTVDSEIFSVTEDSRSDDEIRILVLDHVYPWKGTKEAVEIVSAIKNETNKKIKLIGFGVRRNHPDFLYDEYYFNVGHHDLAQVYAHCDIYLCASWDEGFGLPSLEAMACGVALATYDNGGSRDFAKHAETALVAPRRDQEALQSLVEKLVENRDVRRRIAHDGIVYAQSMPTWREQAEKLVRVFQSVSK